MAGFLLLQFGMTSNNNSTSETTQLADAARASAHAANRGSGRTPETVPAVELAAVGTPVLQATTTVPPTVPPTTTPPTTAKPKPTTTTAKPKPPVVAKVVAPKPADTGATGGDIWQKLANCEAGGRNDLGAPYYGYFQFSAGTWTSLGGTGLPSDHTYEEQKAMAIKLQARSGWGQWPVCAKKIGAY